MIRSWGVQTLTGSAQPVFGDTLTAAFTPVNREGVLNTLTVGSTTRYQIGDRILLGADQAKPNIVIVDQIPDSTHLQVHAEGGATLSAWTNGTIIVLDIACGQVLLQTGSANAGVLWVGSDHTVTNSGGGSAFTYILAGGQFYEGLVQWNAVRTSELWMAGTLNDTAPTGAVVV